MRGWCLWLVLRRCVWGELRLELWPVLYGGAAEEGENSALRSEGTGNLDADDARGPDNGAVLAGEGQRHGGCW